MRTLLYENEMVRRLCKELSRAKKFHLAFGLWSKNGLAEVEEELTRCLEKGSYGRILVGADMPTHPEAIEQLRRLEMDYKDRMELKRFQSVGSHIFHMKLAIFEGATGKQNAILGSSNLTGGGLIGNYEANVYLDNRKIVPELLVYFDEQFFGGYARRIDDFWFNNYRKWWKERQKVERRLRHIRERIQKLPAQRNRVQILPKRIKGSVFAFTGGIEGWVRDTKLYPTIKRFGGKVAANALSIKSADCLVHGVIFRRKKTTNKLLGARKYKIPIIGEDRFFPILENERRLRRRG